MKVGKLASSSDDGLGSMDIPCRPSRASQLEGNRSIFTVHCAGECFSVVKRRATVAMEHDEALYDRCPRERARVGRFAARKVDDRDASPAPECC